MTVREAIGKTGFWLLFNVIFGLTQYFVLLSGDWLGFSKFGAQETIAEGVITFFCASLMASTAVDLVQAKPPFREEVKFILYILPLVAFVDVVFLYSQLHFKPTENYNFDNLSINQWVIIGTAFVYCVWVKIITFRL
jgi:hypothetical protein